MSKATIAGIQQIGIGIPNVHEAFKWYRQHFGMDIPIFEEAAEANLMLPYTGGKAHQRHAILAINMKGGGGFEIPRGQLGQQLAMAGRCHGYPGVRSESCD